MRSFFFCVWLGLHSFYEYSDNKWKFQRKNRKLLDMNAWLWIMTFKMQHSLHNVFMQLFFLVFFSILRSFGNIIFLKLLIYCTVFWICIFYISQYPNYTFVCFSIFRFNKYTLYSSKEIKIQIWHIILTYCRLFFIT